MTGSLTRTVSGMGHGPVGLYGKYEIRGDPGSHAVKYPGIGYGIVGKIYLYRIELTAVELELLGFFEAFRVEYAVPVSIAIP